MDRAAPPAIEFVEALPAVSGPLAVPFITWGGKGSGLALWQLGGRLIQKGFKIVGAVKVLAVHSEMWLSDDPLGKGHPNQSDYRQIEEMIDTLVRRFDSDNIPGVALETLMYQSAELFERIKENLNDPMVASPKQVNLETCTQCGICEDECPAAAVVLNPYPEFGASCFDCLNCIRLCPENAITSTVDLRKIQEKIRAKAQMINEQPPTQIFI
jgi:ferredoxin